MEDQNNSGRSKGLARETEASAMLRPYERPALTSYGSVAELVLSTGASDDIHSVP